MKLELEQTEYWDKVAYKKKFNHKIDWKFLKPFLNPKSKILDCGCGYGRLTKEISDKGFTEVIGIDNSISMIERAKKELPKSNFIHHNKGDFIFANNQFDLVCLFTVLTCIPNNKDQNKLINELKRVLNSNGLLYVSDLLINSDSRNINRYKSSEYEPYGTFKLPEGVILRHHTLDYLKTVVFADLEILYERIYSVITMNGNKSKAIQLIGQKRNNKKENDV